jgi:uncharacterized repeat protein (TIGR02543 family)
MHKRGYSWIFVVALLVGTCQASLTPQNAKAGSLDFYSDAFNGSTTKRIEVAYDDKLDVGSGAFTIEMWVKERSRVIDSRYNPVFWGTSVAGSYGSSIPGGLMWGLNWDCQGKGFAVAHSGQSCNYVAGRELPIAGSGTQDSYYTTYFRDSNWHHIALSKAGIGGAFSFYLDGNRVAYGATDSGVWGLSGGSLVIGANFDGSISNVRLVKGQGLYSGTTIVVPTSELTLTSQGAIASNVSLLLKSGTNCLIEDKSTYSFTIRNIGSVACNPVEQIVTSYNLQFDKQGHGIKPADIGNINSISVGSLPTIANDGNYIFQGWAATPSGSLLTGTYTATTDSTLYAIWASPPEAPTIGTATRLSATTVSVGYTSGANNGSAITGYTSTSSPSVSLTLTSAATANPLTYSGTFVQGQAYTFSMTATNGAGTSSSSGASNSITPYAAAAPAAGIIGSVTSSSATTVSIPFTAPSSNGSAITGYTITSSPALALTYSGTTSPMAVTGAFVQGQSYTFTIAATNGAGTGGASSASNSVTPFAPGNPDAPTIGVATTVDSQTVTVSFSAPINNRGSVITSYTATSNPGGITGTSSSSPINVTGLTVNTAYTFTVTATNGVGTSDSSTATSAVTPRMVYSVTFDSQGGSTISNGSFVSGSSVSAAPSNPTRSGYTFNGWFAASTTGTSLQFPYSPGVTSNITLYAQWTLIPVVVPPAPIPTPVVVTGPPPSTLKTLISPKISRDENVYYCEIGKYVFLREGRTEEIPKLTTQVFSLLLNGKVIETQKSSLAKVSFTKSDSFFNSTLACQVEVGQENLSTTSYSLNSDSMTSHSLTKKKAIEAADAKYYKDRQDAYAKKDLEFARLLAIKTTAIATSKSSKDTLAASLAYQKAFTAASNLWKKELADASTNRVLAKELAQKQYLDALEAAGVSIYPVPAKAVVAPVPEPVPTPTPTPSPSVINVQPTAAMKKVGIFYMASGSYFLNDASKISLKALALKINATEVKQVLVYGHTDIRGGVNNTWLSQQRAKAVASYLRPLLRDKKLVIGWYASSKPIATGTTASDLAKNRRVEIYTK